MKCTKYKRRHTIVILDYCAGDLTPEQTQELEAHARECAPCASEIEEIRLILDVVTTEYKPVEIPDGTVERVHRRIHSTLAAREQARTDRVDLLGLPQERGIETTKYAKGAKEGSRRFCSRAFRVFRSSLSSHTIIADIRVI